MLNYLHVKNLALIEECEINFSKGLNILTGETGAGKSILIGSVNLALGQRAEGDIIRTGASEALVELDFSVDAEIKKLLSDMDISDSEDSLFISRKITPTKSIYRINGETVTAGTVKELAAALIDIHGQHEHQSLLKNSKQLQMIDAFYQKEIEPALEKVALCAAQYEATEKELSELREKAQGSDREISLLSYECKEIEDAALIEGEDETLEEDYKRMQSSEKIMALLNESVNYLAAEDNDNAGSLIQRSLQAASRAAGYDESLDPVKDVLSEAESLIGDYLFKINDYLNTLDFSEEDFVRTEERLNVINNLKMKFGRSIPDILEAYEEKRTLLDKLENIEESLAKAEEKIKECKKAYLDAATKLHELRLKAAVEFSEKLTGELLMLNFNNVNFKAEIIKDETRISRKGFDDVEFMISTNVGEPLREMKNVASGGELSRIMLAIKTILAKRDRVDSLIFDEIDAGISGKTAWEVAKKLKLLSKEHQVITITHLPQIAAAADTHFEIKKLVSGDKTVTVISILDAEGEIRELARLLGSDNPSEAALLNARELKKEACS
jgi:DNA repair protein RecN (Recombination protein N)